MTYYEANHASKLAILSILGKETTTRSIHVTGKKESKVIIKTNHRYSPRDRSKLSSQSIMLLYFRRGKFKKKTFFEIPINYLFRKKKSRQLRHLPLLFDYYEIYLAKFHSILEGKVICERITTDTTCSLRAFFLKKFLAVNEKKLSATMRNIIF